jgi:hypothetical protein
LVIFISVIVRDDDDVFIASRAPFPAPGGPKMMITDLGCCCFEFPPPMTRVDVCGGRDDRDGLSAPDSLADGGSSAAEPDRRTDWNDMNAYE